MSPALLDCPDQISWILRKGTVGEGPVIRMGADEVLNGVMDGRGSKGICCSAFKVSAAQMVKLSCCPEEGGRRNIDN
jgi:hypothetical protein